MTRKRYVAGASVFALLICIGVAMQMPARTNPLKGKVDRIKKGMPIEEAMVILGSNGWDGPRLNGSFVRQSSTWYDEDGSSVYVEFGFRCHGELPDLARCQVLDVHWCESSETVWERLCRWVKKNL